MGQEKAAQLGFRRNRKPIVRQRSKCRAGREDDALLGDDHDHHHLVHGHQHPRHPPVHPWGVGDERLWLDPVACLIVVLSFSLFVFLSFCLFVFLSFCLFVFLSFCIFVFLSFCLVHGHQHPRHPPVHTWWVGYERLWLEPVACLFVLLSCCL